MRIFHLTAGTGSFYCGTCIRDNALVTGLRALGHEAHLVPMYLPLVVDEASAADTAVFLGGVNVYAQQLSPLFRRTPRFVDALLDTTPVLKLASTQAGASMPQDLGPLTLSMLQGEHGRQAKEIDRLAEGLAQAGARSGDWICLSNLLLAGLARRLKERLAVRVACTLQGEDTFLDAMPEPYRSQSWNELAERTSDLDALIAVSRYYGELVARRLRLPARRIQVVWNGITLDDYPKGARADGAPVIGYFARLCRDKGLHTLVDAFIDCARGGNEHMRLLVGGTVTDADKAFVKEQQEKLRAAGLEDRAEFHPNVDRAGKLALLRRMTIFCVPAMYGEAFGLYNLEALAAGVPVVAPRHAAFPELIEATGGGVLCDPGDAKALAGSLEALLVDEPRRLALGQRGREVVHDRFSAIRMASDYVAALESVGASVGISTGISTSQSKGRTMSDAPTPSLAWLGFALATVAFWGLYGVLLHAGQLNMHDAANGRYKAFLFVGVAYFVTAVLAPAGLLAARGATWEFPASGMSWSFIAGVAGAAGALFTLLAFGAGGSPASVMAIVFGGAPIVNAIVALMVAPPAGGVSAIKFPFYLGLLLAACGGYLVTKYRPPPAPHAPAPAVRAATTAQ